MLILKKSTRKRVFHACADLKLLNRLEPNFAHRLRGGRINKFGMTSKLVEWFRRGWGAKFGLSH